MAGISSGGFLQKWFRRVRFKCIRRTARGGARVSPRRPVSYAVIAGCCGKYQVVLYSAAGFSWPMDQEAEKPSTVTAVMVS